MDDPLCSLEAGQRRIEMLLSDMLSLQREVASRVAEITHVNDLQDVPHVRSPEALQQASPLCHGSQKYHRMEHNMSKERHEERKQTSQPRIPSSRLPSHQSEEAEGSQIIVTASDEGDVHGDDNLPLQQPRPLPCERRTEVNGSSPDTSSSGWPTAEHFVRLVTDETESSSWHLKLKRLPDKWPLCIELQPELLVDVDGSPIRPSRSRSPILSQNTKITGRSRKSNQQRCILRPDSCTHIGLDIFGAVLLLVEFTLVPVILAWEVPIRGGVLQFAVSTAIFWTGDILVSFFTAYSSELGLVTDRRLVIKHYFRTSFVWVRLWREPMCAAPHNGLNEPSGTLNRIWRNIFLIRQVEFPDFCQGCLPPHSFPPLRLPGSSWIPLTPFDALL